MSTISWTTPTQPLPMTYDAQTVFEDLFASGVSEAERAENPRIDRNILNKLMHNITTLKKNLNTTNHSRVDNYLNNVHEIEQRIQNIETYNANKVKRKIPNAPMTIPES